MTYEQTIMEHEIIGFEKGYAQGFVQEYAQGFAKNPELARATMVMSMLKENISLENIAFGMDLTVDEVTAIIKKFNLQG